MRTDSPRLQENCIFSIFVYFENFQNLFLKQLLLLVVLLQPAYVLALSVSGPSHNTSGHYTITWNGSVSSSHQILRKDPIVVKENGTKIYEGTSGTAKGRSNKNNGTYVYTIKRCYVYRIVHWSSGGVYEDKRACPTAQKTVTVTRPPSAPATLNVTANSCHYPHAPTVSTQWGDSTGEDGYRLYESAATGSYQIKATQSGRNKTLSGQQENTEYQYYVEAYQSEGAYFANSDKRYSSTMTTPHCAPSMPGAFSVSGAEWQNNRYQATSGTDYILNWGAASGAVHYYELLNAEGELVETINASSGGSYTATAGLPGGTMAYQVQACNEDDLNRKVCGPPTPTQAIYTPYMVPEPPMLSANNIRADNLQFIAEWNPPSGEVSYYVLEQRQVGGAHWSQIYEGEQTTRVVNGLSNGEDYEYRLSACNIDGCSDPSEILTVNMPEPPPGVPGVPSFIDSHRQSVSGDYPVIWGEAEGEVTRYEIEESSAKTALMSLYPVGMALNISYTDKPNDFYHYRVRACNNDGCGLWGALESVVVVRPPKAPAVPTDDIGYYNDPGPAQGDPFYGALQGQHSVSTSGAFTYTLPIAVPPGTAGMAPKLSLDYNHQQGNGVLGQGWAIGGLSVITRCPQTVSQSGHAKSITLSNEDRFCLNGQNLHVVQGDYGKNGAEYRAEQNDFSRIVSTGQTQDSPSGFTVYTKSGEIMYYGRHQNRSDALIESRDTQIPVVWALVRVEDGFSNYIDYFYDNNTAAGEYYLSRIEYTGHMQSGQVADQRIEFNYTPRDDIRFRYIGGAQRRISQRLSNIVTAQGQYTLTYAASQSATAGHINEISFCSAEGPCLAPLTFDWANSTEGNQWQRDDNFAISVDQVVGAGKDNGVRFIDINADGLTDALTQNATYINTGDPNAPWSSSDYPASPLAFVNAAYRDNGVRLVDLDGDGLQDMIRSTLVPAKSHCDVCGTHEPTHMEREAWRNTGSGWAPVSAAYTNSNLPIIITGGDAVEYADYGVRFVDFDGDGKTDFLKGHGINLEAWRNTGSGWLIMPDWKPPVAFVDEFHISNAVQIIDVNADGLPDIVQGQHDTRRTWLNTGHGWQEHLTHLLPIGLIDAEFKDTGIRFNDLNGDGLVDIIRTQWRQDNPCASTYFNASDCSREAVDRAVWLNTGVSWDRVNEHYDTDIPGIIDPREEDLGVRLVDLNGDGLMDVLSDQSAWLNTGNGWQATGDFSGPLAFSAYYDVNDDNPKKNRSNGTQLVDLNGDGLIDIVHGKAGVRRAWINRSQRLVIDAVIDGLTNTLQVQYGNMSDPDLYSPGSIGNQTGHRHVAGPLQWVKTIEVSNGQGGTLSDQYHYKGLKSSSDGRGLLGFEAMTVTNPLGIVTTTTYAQGYPYTGQVLQTETRYGNRLLSRHSVQYCYLTESDTESIADGQSCPEYNDSDHNGWIFVYPYHSEKTQYLPGDYNATSDALAGSADSTTVSSYTRFDEYGNPTQISVSTLGSDGRNATVNTLNQYSPGNAEHRRLGRLTRANVSTTHPDGSTTLRTTAFEYDSGHSLLSKDIIEPEGGPELRLETTYARDAYGNITSSTVSDGSNSRQTKTTYTANGRFALSTSNALDETEGYETDPVYGNRLRLIGPNGIQTCWQYDALGRVISETIRCDSTEPLTTSTSYYWSNGTGTTQGVNGAENLYAATTIEITPPIGSASRRYIDRQGREVRTQQRGFNGEYILRDTLYDRYGRVREVSDPYYHQTPNPLLDSQPYWSISQFDPLGRLTQSRQPLGDINGDGSDDGHHVIDSYYDGYTTRSERLVNGQSRQRQETKNGLGQTASITDADNQTIIYEHDAHGNLKQTSDPQGNRITITYDILSRKIELNDPDMGQWGYQYNAFSELVRQTDAKGQTTQIQYDALGRITSRTMGTAETSVWEYYGAEAPPGSVGQLKSMQGTADPRLNSGSCGNTPIREYQYTRNGQLKIVEDCIDGQWHQTDRRYDTQGRLSILTYPQANNQRLQVQHHYNAEGYLHYLSDPNDNNQLFWLAKSLNAKGQLVEEQNRNGVKTHSDYNQATGWLITRRSEADTDTLATTHNRHHIQRSHFSYDEAGNLLRRARADDHLFADTVEETFSYDSLDRLLSSTVNNHNTGDTHSTEIHYDAIGNPIYRSDLGAYQYNNCTAGTRAAGPHAVCSVGGNALYHYDANGNMIDGHGRSIQYSAYNKPTSITHHHNNATAEFVYGADRSRVLRVTDDDFRAERIRYIGLGAEGGTLFEHKTITESGVQENLTEQLHFIYAGTYHNGHAFAVHAIRQDGVQNGNTATGTEYYHRDHLGSVIAITDDTGVMYDAADQPRGTLKSYDAWGKRRNADWSVDIGVELGEENTPGGTNPYTSINGHLCYTGQESITEVGLIHMNGRVYDPEIGRFLSADPHVQFETDPQNYNRYSYVNNNPLKYTDPSGYFIRSHLKNTVGRLSPEMITAISTALNFVPFCQVWCAALLNAEYSYANGGSIGEAGFAFAGGAFGGAAGDVISGAGLSVLGEISLQGSISGAFSGAINAITTDGDLWEGFVEGAAIGVATSAAMVGLRSVANEVMQGSQAQKEMRYLLMQANDDGGRALLEMDAFFDNHGGQGNSFAQGFKQYFKDQARFLKNLDNVSGANGQNAKEIAAFKGGLLLDAFVLFANDATVPVNGRLVNVRSESMSALGEWIADNPRTFAGRLSANIGTTAAISGSFLRAPSPIGLGATFVLGVGLTTTSGVGAGLHAIDAGASDPVSIMSRVLTSGDQ